MIKYTAPEMEVIAVETEDIVLSSTGNGNTGSNTPELPDDEF